MTTLTPPPIALVGRNLKEITQHYQIKYQNLNKKLLNELTKAHIAEGSILSPADFVNKYLPFPEHSTRARNGVIIDMWHKLSRVNKFVICSRRCQGGKTWIVIKAIQDTPKNTLNIVYTMNSLMNTEQFSSRMKDEFDTAQEEQIKELEKTVGENNVWVLSSVNTGKLKNHVKTLGEAIAKCASKKECPKVIVMCAHPKRLKEGFELIDKLHNDISCPHIDTINVYYDELHSYIKMGGRDPFMRNGIKNIDKLDKVGEIMGITATPGPIWLDDEYFEDLWIRPLEHGYNDDDYCSSADMTFINHELGELGEKMEHEVIDKESGEPKMIPYEPEISYAIGILEKYPDILAKGKSAFIPGLARSCATHIQVMDIVMEKSQRRAIVVMLNGADKSFRYYKDPSDEDSLVRVELGKTKGELSQRISELRNDGILDDRPLVYTGHICVSMGQTLVNKSLGPLDYEILGHENMSPEDIYQLAGRGLGRMKGWDKSYNTKVYCPTSVMYSIRCEEKCTYELPLRHGGRSIKYEEFIAPMETMEGGDIVAAALKARLPKKLKQRVNKTKKHGVYDTQKACADFVFNTFGICFGLRNDRAINDWFKTYDRNPTLAEIIERFAHLDKTHLVRMVPTDLRKWVCYWHPEDWPKLEI